MEEAGGIGGLLIVFDNLGGSYHFPGYDGIGNVTCLVKGDGAVSATYEYGPFGEPIRVHGTFAKGNPFRFSTKFIDDESGLIYYGHRFYSSFLGRWINRDPIEQGGGLNLYAFVLNNGVNGFDALGMDGT